MRYLAEFALTVLALFAGILFLELLKWCFKPAWIYWRARMCLTRMRMQHPEKFNPDGSVKLPTA